LLAVIEGRRIKRQRSLINDSLLGQCARRQLAEQSQGGVGVKTVTFAQTAQSGQQFFVEKLGVDDQHGALVDQIARPGAGEHDAVVIDRDDRHQVVTAFGDQVAFAPLNELVIRLQDTKTIQEALVFLVPLHELALSHWNLLGAHTLAHGFHFTRNGAVKTLDEALQHGQCISSYRRRDLQGV